MSAAVNIFQYTLTSGKRMYGYRFETCSIKNSRKWTSKRGFKTKKEAMRAGVEAQKQYENTGRYVVPSEISYSDFLDLWLDSLIGLVKVTTLENYRKKVNLYIRPYLGAYRLKSIKREDLRKLLRKLSENGCSTKEQGLSKNTMTVVKGILTKSFNFAVDEEYITESPASGNLRLPREDTFSDDWRGTSTNPHVYIPARRIKQIFERFPEGTSTHIALMLGYKCGLRIGEAFAVCWEDINFEEKTLTVNKQVQWYKNPNKTNEENDSHIRRLPRHEVNPSGFWYFSLPKYNSERIIEIDSELLELLKREKAQQDKDKPYFAERYFRYYIDKRGKILKGAENAEGNREIHFVSRRRDGEFVSPRTIQHVSRVVHNQLHYPEFDFHSLRHTHATMLAENGALPTYVQHRLGHKDIAVTMRVYYHYTKKMQEKGINILENMYMTTEA